MRLKNTLLIYPLLSLGLIMLSCAKKTTPATPTPTAIPPTFTFTAFGITCTGVQYSISNGINPPSIITGSNGDNTASNYQMVQITISSNISSTGAYTLSSPVGSGGCIAEYATGASPSITYNTNASHTGTLNVTKIDNVARTMSASYSFVAQQYNSANTGTVSVSGSFTDVGF
ncbi:MAG: hypothetical protein ACYDEC_09220 [Bacteroidia bacterium]